MKNFLNAYKFYFIIVVFSLFNLNTVLADSFNNNEKINITKIKNDSDTLNLKIISGLDLKKDDKPTFNKTLNITGVAQKGSTINITVSKKLEKPDDEKQIFEKVENYSLKVGATGYFNQIIDLFVGDNYITITASKDDTSQTLQTTVTKKNSEIKSELEQAIALPNSNRK